MILLKNLLKIFNKKLIKGPIHKHIWYYYDDNAEIVASVFVCECGEMLPCVHPWAPEIYYLWHRGKQEWILEDGTNK